MVHADVLELNGGRIDAWWNKVCPKTLIVCSRWIVHYVISFSHSISSYQRASDKSRLLPCYSALCVCVSSWRVWAKLDRTASAARRTMWRSLLLSLSCKCVSFEWQRLQIISFNYLTPSLFMTAPAHTHTHTNSRSLLRSLSIFFSLPVFYLWLLNKRGDKKMLPLKQADSVPLHKLVRLFSA